MERTFNPKKHPEQRRKRSTYIPTHEIIFEPYERISKGGVKHINYKKKIARKIA